MGGQVPGLLMRIQEPELETPQSSRSAGSTLENTAAGTRGPDCLQVGLHACTSSCNHHQSLQQSATARHPSSGYKRKGGGGR